MLQGPITADNRGLGSAILFHETSGIGPEPMLFSESGAMTHPGAAHGKVHPLFTSHLMADSPRVHHVGPLLQCTLLQLTSSSLHSIRMNSKMIVLGLALVTCTVSVVQQQAQIWLLIVYHYVCCACVVLTSCQSLHCLPHCWHSQKSAG